jgi:catalase
MRTPVSLAPTPPLRPFRAFAPPVSPVSPIAHPVPLAGRSIGILLAPGVDAGQVEKLQIRIRRAGGHVELIAPSLAVIETPRGATLMPDGTFTTRSPFEYDALVVPGGDLSGLRSEGAAVAFVARAFLHAMPIGVVGDGAGLLNGVSLPDAPGGIDVIANGTAVVRATHVTPEFTDALASLVARNAPHTPDPDLHRIAS